MYYDFLILGILLVIGVVFVYANMIVGDVLFRPNKPNELKLSTYECGEEAFGTSWIRFDMRFYTVALIFVVFDLEIAFLFPWASVFGDSDLGSIVLVEGMIFITILFLGLVYVWAKGDLDWVKAFSEGKAIVTGVHPSDFTAERAALYQSSGKGGESPAVEVAADADKADGGKAADGDKVDAKSQESETGQ